MSTRITGISDYVYQVTGNVSLEPSDSLVQVDASGGSVTVTLLDPTIYIGLVVQITRTDSTVANTLTLTATSGTVAGASNYTGLAYLGAVIRLQSDGTNWVVITPQAIPPGTILPYGGASAPTGYLLCDGSSVLRATYPALFGVLGTTFGSADGTHFTLPNMVGRFPFGVSASGTGNALGATFGSIDHLHTVNPPNTTTGADSNDLTQPPSVVGTPNTAAAAHTHDVDIAQFNSGTANPPGLSLNFIIKV